MYFDQSSFDIRFEWGLQGLQALVQDVSTIVIVDVLSFSTAVDVAISRGASVYPYAWKDNSAVEFARSMHAVLAGERRGKTGYSLSPASLRTILPGTALV